MLRRVVTLVLRPRHYWRSLSFDEIAELYVSRLLMVFGINVVNLFVAVYLHQLGYSLVFIGLFYGVIYTVKIPLALIAARYVAYFGPKHGIFISSCIRILSMVALVLVPQYGLPAIIIFGLVQQMAAAVYEISYMVSFSKIKHALHAGKEIGVMQIMEKIAKIAGPIAGGLLATFFGPQTAMVFAGVTLIIATLPLFRSAEPTRLRMKLKFAGFPWRYAFPTLVSQTATGVDFVASGMSWALFIALFIFGTIGDGIYSAIGFLASFGVLVSMLAAWTFGRLIDRRRGRSLLIGGTVVNSLLHLARPYLATPAGAVMVSTVNESATTAYFMVLTRTGFDIADNSGARIVYMMLHQMAVNAGAAVAAFSMAALVWHFGEYVGLVWLFGVAAVYELLLLASTRQSK